MLLPRIIPVLLIENGAFVKTKLFKKPDYIGDPVNVINLFNRFEVDEIIILDISATRLKKHPDFELIENLANECWVPLAYGGGIKNIDQVKKLFELGIEKIILNNALIQNPALVKTIVKMYGSQAIIGSVDLKKDIWGKIYPYTLSGRHKIKRPYLDYIKAVEELGVGEIFINFIDRDGQWNGYDNTIIKDIIDHIEIPTVICGGASNRSDFIAPLKLGASGVAAGSLFVYKSQGKGVLINFPERNEIEDILIKAKRYE